MIRIRYLNRPAFLRDLYALILRLSYLVGRCYRIARQILVALCDCILPKPQIIQRIASVCELGVSHCLTVVARSRDRKRQAALIILRQLRCVSFEGFDNRQPSVAVRVRYDYFCRPAIRYRCLSIRHIVARRQIISFDPRSALCYLIFSFLQAAQRIASICEISISHRLTVVARSRDRKRDRLLLILRQIFGFQLSSDYLRQLQVSCCHLFIAYIQRRSTRHYLNRYFIFLFNYPTYFFCFSTVSVIENKIIPIRFRVCFTDLVSIRCFHFNQLIYGIWRSTILTNKV